MDILQTPPSYTAYYVRSSATISITAVGISDLISGSQHLGMLHPTADGVHGSAKVVGRKVGSMHDAYGKTILVNPPTPP